MRNDKATDVCVALFRVFLYSAAVSESVLERPRKKHVDIAVWHKAVGIAQTVPFVDSQVLTECDNQSTSTGPSLQLQ